MTGSWWQALRHRIEHFCSDSDMEDELSGHFEMEVEERVATGEHPSEARLRARLALGDTKVAIERVRDGEWMTAIEGWGRDIAFGVRNLRKAPVFFFTAVITLALGMGASTAVFSFLYGLVLRPLPTNKPAQLVQLGLTSNADAGYFRNSFVTFRMLEDLRKELTSYEDISGWNVYDLPIENADGSLRRVDAGLITGNAFNVVPMRPYLGRLIAPFDDVPSGGAHGWPVVLSYGFWTDRLGRDPQVIGKQLKISGAPATVVGVTPPEFNGLRSAKTLSPGAICHCRGEGQRTQRPKPLVFHACDRPIETRSVDRDRRRRVGSLEKPFDERLRAGSASTRPDLRRCGYTRKFGALRRA